MPKVKVKFDNFVPEKSENKRMGKMLQKKLLLFAICLFCIRLTGLHAQSVKDADGNIYLAIKIGKQVWMAENLKTTKFNDGKAIPLVVADKEWEALKTPAYCWYNNEIKNKDIYGALYNWYTVNAGKLCPKDWHVSTDPEWETMIDFLGDKNKAGDKLKEAGTTHWKSFFSGATNEYDFTALPGGLRYFSGTFPIFGDSYAIWWTSTEYSTSQALNRGLHDSNSGTFKGSDNKRSGFSVRCIKD
jgi:uncharacterized protein (TIGR02145 family)